MSYIRIQVDTDDVLEECDTDDLISELESRTDLPPKYRAVASVDKIDYSKTPIRDAVISLYKLHPTASLGEIIQSVSDNYYK